jgi:hypothetical protein
VPTITCAYGPCSTEFYSKHSTAKYCSRRCSGTATMSQPEIALKHRDRMRKYSDEFLLETLCEQAKVLGRTPSRREIRPGSWVYQQRFGGYNAAVIAAGLAPNVALPKAYLENDREVIPLSLRFEVLNRDGFTCQYCGGTPQGGYVLHVDHRVARSAGGKTVLSNLITACWLCNIGKSATNLDG